MADFHFEPEQVQTGLDTFSSSMQAEAQSIAGFIADFNSIPEEDLGGCDAALLDNLSAAFNQAKAAADSLVTFTNKFGEAMVQVGNAYATGGEKAAESAANDVTKNMQDAATEADGATSEYGG